MYINMYIIIGTTLLYERTLTEEEGKIPFQVRKLPATQTALITKSTDPNNYIGIYVYLYVYMYIYIKKRSLRRVLILIIISVCMYIYIFMCVCIYMYVYVCLYVYIIIFFSRPKCYLLLYRYFQDLSIN
jgi:hypothetical protein